MNNLNDLDKVVRHETTTTITPVTTDAPSAQEFIYFTKLGTDPQQVALHFISDSATFCHFLASCRAFQLFYLSPLLTNEGRARVGGEVTAQQVFNKHPSFRTPIWILRGPGGEALYAKFQNILGGPLTFRQLRDGTLSVEKVKERESNPQARWMELKSQLLESLQQQANPNYKVLERIEWLDDQMMAATDSESVKSELGPYLRKCILDGSWPLKDIVQYEQYQLLELTSFARFLNSVPGDNQDELTVNELAELFHSYSRNSNPGHNDRMQLIWCDHYVQKALRGDELRIKHLVKLYQSDAERVFWFALYNKVTRAYLESGELTAKHLMELVMANPALSSLWWKSLKNAFVQHDFFNQFSSLIGLLEKQDCVAIMSLCMAIRNPYLHEHLNGTVEQVQLCWQHIFDLVNQKEKWFPGVHIPKDLMADEVKQCEIGLSQLGCCDLLTKLSMSLTTQAITKYMSGENKEKMLTMSEWRDLIVEEDIETAPFNPLLLKSFPHIVTGKADQYKEDLPGPPFYRVLDKCTITPFHYAKIALALCHPEAHTLSLEKLKERLKGDPLSGYRVALFGLSGPHDDEYRNRIENNFAEALSDSKNQALLIQYKLSMEELFAVVREEGRSGFVHNLSKNSPAV